MGTRRNMTTKNRETRGVIEMKAIVVRKLQPSKTVQKTIISPFRI